MCKVSVVIVNWNSGPFLGRCLASLRAQSPVSEIVVVDNGSSDDSLAPARALHNVKVIEVGTNLGYAAAANLGIDWTELPYILISNPDVEFCPGALASLARVLDTVPSVGLAGPRLLNADGSYQPSVRRFPTPLLWLFDGTLIADLWPNNPCRHWLLASDRPAGSSGPVDWLSGAALMARRSAVDHVGKMDPGYYMYSEELDWCRRFRQLGWQVWYEARASAVHHGQISSSQVPVQTHVRYQVSRLRYVQKYFGTKWGRVFRTALYADYLARLAVEGTKWILGHRRGLRRERMLIYLQVLASRFACPPILPHDQDGTPCES